MLSTMARALFKSFMVKEKHAELLPAMFYRSCPIFKKERKRVYVVVIANRSDLLYAARAE